MKTLGLGLGLAEILTHTMTCVFYTYFIFPAEFYNLGQPSKGLPKNVLETEVRKM